MMRFGNLKMWRFENWKMGKFGDLKMRKFEDLKIWKFGDLKMPCNRTKHPFIPKFPNFQISKSPLRLHIIAVLFFSFFISNAQHLPDAPDRLVADYTGTLRQSEISALEQKLRAFEDSTSNQIAVVLVATTDGYDVADYAVRLANKWGIGSKKHNNGILLLAAIRDRAVTIQTGYGMEGALPDVIAYRIIQNEIKPAFRQRDYFGGLNRATDAIISHTKGEYTADPKARTRESGRGGSLVVIIIVVIVIALLSRNGGGGRRRGNMMSGRGSSDVFWWTLLNDLGRGGSGGGGFGGGSGGGFGGFGGGSFGGGGASGRW